MNHSIEKSVSKKGSSKQLLYEQDYALWIQETINNLSNQNFQEVDWENLIEEVKSLGKSEQRALRSYLTRLLEHLLKRCYVNLPECYKGWEKEIRNFRHEIEEILLDSPSLKAYLAKMQDRCSQKAWKNVMEDYPDINFPATCPFDTDMENILSKKYW